MHQGHPAQAIRVVLFDPYKYEKKIMRVKQYDHLKIPNLPKSASDARAFRNSVFNLVCKLAKGDEEPVLKWIEKCVDPKAFESLNDSLPFPLLDPCLGAVNCWSLVKIFASLCIFRPCKRHTKRKHKQPKGRQLLWIILRRIRWKEIAA